jgi:hypothetical protein
VTSSAGSPARRPASPELGDGHGVAEEVRRLQVDEVRDRGERRVEALAGEDDRQRGLGGDDRLPGVDLLEAVEQHGAVGDDHVGQRRVELLAGPLAGERLRRTDAAHAVGDLDELRELRDAAGQRDVIAASALRPAAAVPALVGVGEAIEDLVGQPQLRGERPRHRRMVLDHPAHVAVAGDGELEPEAEAVQRRLAGAEQPHRRRRAGHARHLVLELDRLERDVIAEPPGLLVGVGVAADADQESRVVDARAPLLVEPGALGQPQGDQALAQHVLHGLAEGEVDPEREGGNQLREADVSALGHAPSVTRHGAARQRPSGGS